MQSSLTVCTGMTITMAWLKVLPYYVLCTIIFVTAQYTRDSEYNDFYFYEDLSTDYSENFDKEYIGNAQDDYVVKVFDDTENQSGPYSDSKDYHAALENSIDSFKKRDPFDKQFGWYKLPEKVYRYTKHRIPGYDYDEFVYMRSRDFKECDDKSVWTHCLCQFTCSKPNVVDCYTPCRSGCECKEKYVFDERRQRCLLPEHCSSEDDYNYKI